MADNNPLVDPASQPGSNSLSATAMTTLTAQRSSDALDSGPGGDWLSGTGLLDDCLAVANDIKQHKASTTDGIAVTLDVLGAVIDPVGTAVSALAGWMLDHLQPLKQLLDDLAGNPDTVTGVANTWSNISTALAATATSYTSGVNQQTRDWQGSAADAYRTQAGKLVQALGGAAALADAMNNISLIGAEIVATVRGTVRDTISTLIGFLADLAIEEACSVGLATPVVIAQGVKDIGEAAKEIAEAIDDACTMLGVALGLAAKANTMWAEIIKVMPNLEATIGNIGVAAQAHSPTNR